jgi:hypothetical protein
VAAIRLAGIYGSLGVGSLKVRPPNRFDQRRIAGKTGQRELDS